MSSPKGAKTAQAEASPNLDPSSPPDEDLPEYHEEQTSSSASSYFSFPVTHVVSGLYRRLTEPSPQSPSNPPNRSSTEPMNLSASDIVYTPRRTASPFQPPPLTPLTLKSSPEPSNQLLTRALAEEIRLLVPPRLQLVDTWVLAYSLDRDGSSLSTLFEKSSHCAARSQRAGYVLVVKNVPSRDISASVNGDRGGGGGGGSLFGAYLTDPPHPAAHYFGTGECFLWRASTLTSTPLLHAGPGPAGKPSALDLASLPPPPSADTSHLRGRSTTFHADGTKSGTSTPDRIRFKAFPYSGVNDYLMFCETGFLSVGGGDGHYGLWLDNSFEKGVSSPCLTFGNEPLCDEGTKFDVMNVELWYIGN